MGTSPAEFVIHTDRRATNRWHGGIIAMHAILAVILVVAILIVSNLTAERDMSGLAWSPFLILLVGQMFQLSIHSYLWAPESL